MKIYESIKHSKVNINLNSKCSTILMVVGKSLRTIV